MAIVPPKTTDPALTRRLITQVSDRLPSIYGSKLCKEFKVIPLDQSLEVFDTLGLNSFFSQESWEMNSNQLRFLQGKLDVTHLAFLEEFTTNTFKLALYPIHEGIEYETYKVGQEITASANAIIEFSNVNPTPNWVRLALLMAPNSFTLGFASTQVSFEGPEGFNEINTKTKSSLPPIISAFSIETIEHPIGYREFDYAASLFPGFYGYAVDQSTTFSYGIDPNPATRTTGEVSVKTIGICPHFTGQISLFWPLGTTHLGVGGAGCVAARQALNSKPVVFGAPAMRYAMGHRVFFSERLYVFFSSEAVSLQNAYFYRDSQIKSRTVTRLIFGLGYFQPGNQSKVSELLGYR